LLPDQLLRDRAGAGGDVEDRVAGAGLDARDEEAPPARVLAEREEPRVAVVRRPERREQLLRVLPAGRERRHERNRALKHVSIRTDTYRRNAMPQWIVLVSLAIVAWLVL